MAASLLIIAGESGLSRYLNQIRRFPMLEPQEEYTLAKHFLAIRPHPLRDGAPPPRMTDRGMG